MINAAQCFNKFGAPKLQANMVNWYLPDSLRVKYNMLPRCIYINKLMLPHLFNALEEIAAAGLANELKSYDGCFNIRTVRGGKSWSMHSWGVAIDFNASTNQMGHTPTMNQRVVDIFKSNGFDWGGDWHIPDGMHFQLKSL